VADLASIGSELIKQYGYDKLEITENGDTVPNSVASTSVPSIVSAKPVEDIDEAKAKLKAPSIGSSHKAAVVDSK
jgi:hypothetical protein